MSQESRQLHALQRFVEVSAACAVSRGFERSVVLRSADTLAVGLDGPALREVAGLPLDVTWLDLSEPLLAALQELGASSWWEDSEQTALFAARFECQRFVSGELTPRQLTQWFHQFMNHDGPEICRALVDLDDLFDEPGWAEEDMNDQAERLSLLLLHKIDVWAPQR